jgi:hypothetical protein
MDFYNKYIKYKQKYLKLKNLQGGVLPFVELDDKTKDYFPFDNNNFNYYNDDGYTLILNNKKDKVKVDYLLNKNFKLDKLELNLKQKSDFNKKNIINNNNIYKLADEQIIISDEIKFPFHLCLLSKYNILDKLYLKHINIKIEDILNKNFKKIYLINNAKIVFKNIFNFISENRILNITYNYNILLKYSYCNNFLELLKLIYNIQSKIDYKNFDIITKDIKILFNDENYNFEDYIVVHIINYFIEEISKLKNNFDIIYFFYKEEQLEIEKKKEEKKKEQLENEQFEIKQKQLKKEEQTKKKEEQKKEQFEMEKKQLEMEKEQLEMEMEKEQFKMEKKQLEKKLLELEKKEDFLELKIKSIRIGKEKEEEKKQLINKTIEEKLLIIKEKKSIIEEEQLKIKYKIKELIRDEEKELKIDYINAIQTYINISDTTLLFKYISIDDVHFRQDKTNELLKNNILKKIQNNDLNKDLQSLKEHLENDINDIKQLLLFNLYVDNEIDISPKFSHIFYTSFINYRINKPLISYEILLNLYPININNFVCNLIGIENNTLVKLINVNEEKSDMSINKKMFISTYIKHPIHSFEGITIRTETYNYKNCVENGILEFIKILFWDQRQFEIKLPDENKKTKTKTFLLLEEIFNDINQNLKNITSFYESPEYNKKIDKLFSGHDNILYKKFESKYEIISNMDNFYKMLCIILNFENEEKLNKYLETINEYNSNITEIIITDGLIEIRIENYKLYTITIETGHTYLSSFDNINIFDLIKYEYLNLLIYNTNIISNYNKEVCKEYIYKYKNELLKNKEDDNFKYYEYIVILIIINYPILTIDITNDFPNNIEIINKAFEKNYKILCYLNLNKDDIIIICNKILKNKGHANYIDIIKCIVKVSVKFKLFENIDIPIDQINHEDLFEIVMSNIGYIKPNCTLINYLFNKHNDYIIELFKNIDKNHKKYKFLAICILRLYPKFIKDIPIYQLDRKDFSKIVINSIKVDDKINCDIIEYLVKYHYDIIEKVFNKDNMIIKFNDNYKDLIICILSLCPEFIKNISIYDNDFPEILINTIKLKDENDEKVDYLFNYLVNKDLKHTIKLLNKIDQKHYTKLRIFIENYPNYYKLLMEDFFNYNIK